MAASVRVLVVGVGSIGERQLRCFQATGRTVVSLCEIESLRREQVAKRYQVERAYERFEDALAEHHDVAVICTPAHLHIPMAIQLAEAGVHLLIEKPLSTSLHDVDRLRRVIERRQVVSAVAYVQRALPAMSEMKRAIDSGRFGRPVQIVAQCGQHFPTYRPAYREIYYTRRETGGGAIQDALTHVLNSGEWLIGPIDRLAADAAHQVLEGVEVEDTVHVITRQGDALGCYSLNQHQAPNEVVITVVCERGAARAELHRNRWRWMTQPGDSWHDENQGELSRDDGFITQANCFLDAVDGKEPPLCSLSEGVQTLRVNLAVLAAAQSDRWRTIAHSQENQHDALSQPQ